MDYFLVVVGFVLLMFGAEVLVRGASRLAIIFGISPLVVGLTVVAFGTSSPELAVSLQAVWTDEADLTLGNVIGSNIFNMLVILGSSALVLPLAVAPRLIRIDLPLMVALSVVVLLLALNDFIGRLEGFLLTATLVGYITLTAIESRKDSDEVKQEYEKEIGKEARGLQRLPQFNLGLVLVGLVLLALGARWLVDGATEIALDLGVSDLIVGLTIVAIGTSLPEVATSVVAALRGERDIAVGNAVGSNLFNLLAVLGISSLISPAALEVPKAALNFDLPVMVIIAAAMLPIFLKRVITRLEGGLFLGYYVAYLVYTVLDASDHSALAAFEAVMLAVVIPLTTLIFLVLLVRQLRIRGQLANEAK